LGNPPHEALLFSILNQIGIFGRHKFDISILYEELEAEQVSFFTVDFSETLPKPELLCLDGTNETFSALLLWRAGWPGVHLVLRGE
jgi:hypothetical protein